MNKTLAIDYLTHLINRTYDLKSVLQDIDEKEDIDNGLLNPMMSELADACASLEMVHHMAAGECPGCGQKHVEEE